MLIEIRVQRHTFSSMSSGIGDYVVLKPRNEVNIGITKLVLLVLLNGLHCLKNNVEISVKNYRLSTLNVLSSYYSLRAV